MKYILLIFSLMTIGCAKQVTNFSVDPALMPYYEAFVKEGQDRGNNQATNDLSMNFGETTGNVIGYCRRQESYNWNLLTKETVSTPVVVVKPSWWKNATEASRRELVYHELGHCLMDKDHNNQKSMYGQPESIMYPIHIGGSFFQTWERNYLDQLFGLRLFALSESNGQPATVIASNGNGANQASEAFEGVRTVIYTSTLDGCEDEEHFHDEIIEIEDNLVPLTENEETYEQN